MPVSNVQDVVNELNGRGSGLSGVGFTIWDTAAVTSGQVSDKITEADAYLRNMVGSGPSDATGTFEQSLAKGFEINYAASRLLASIAGIQVTDGFNVNLGGTQVQMTQAKFQQYKEGIEKRFEVSKNYIIALHQWFFIYNPEQAQGLDEFGTPVSYWNTSQGDFI